MKHLNSMVSGRKLPTTLALASALMLPNLVRAQFAYYESFTGTTAPGWVFQQGDSAPGPALTTNLSSNPDPDGSGWLRLTTQNVGNQANAVFLNTKIPASNNFIDISFDLAMYGGSGADGFTFFLYDAAVDNFSPGAYGGSLGYANRTSIGGMPGGYLGIAFDNYGNNSNSGEGRNGGLEDYISGGYSDSTLFTNAIVVRGPDTGALGGQDGFDFLASTGGIVNGTTVNGINTTVLDEFGQYTTVNALTQQMDTSATTRPSEANIISSRIVIDENDMLTINIRYSPTAAWNEVMVLDLSSVGVRPDELRIGFAGSTGGSNQTIEMRRIDVEATSLSGTWFWDNGQGSASKFWGDADGEPAPGHAYNWKPNTNPGTGLAAGETPNVVFNNQYVAEDQYIIVQDGNKTVNSMTFGGQYEYTLQPDATELNLTITFDKGTSAQSASYINILNNASGNADHTINVNIQLNNELQVDHFVENELTFGGDVNQQSYTFNVETVGAVTVSGDISGSGLLVKDQSGRLILEGDNSARTGDIDVNAGILVARTNTALGVNSSANTTDIVVDSGATLAFDALNGTNIYRANDIEFSGTGHSGLGALLALAGDNTVDAGSHLQMVGSSSVGAEAGTTLRLNAYIDTNNDDSNTYTFTKVGDGTVELNGDNRYRGVTTVAQGTLSIGADAPASAGTYGSLGNANSTVQLGSSATGTSNFALVTNANGVDINRAISVNNYGGTATLGGTHTTGTSNFTGAITLNKDVTLTAAGTGTVNFTGAMTGGYTATKEGTGTVVIANTTGLSGMTINQGTLSLTSTDADNGVPRVVLANTAGANLALNASGNGSFTIYSLNGGGTAGGNVNLGNDNLTIGNGSTATSTFGGVISGTGNVAVGYNQTVTLTNNNTYTGTTTMNGVVNLANASGEALSGTTNINNSWSGNLNWQASNQLGNSTSLTMGGGTFTTNGFDEVLGTFVFSQNTTFNMNGDGSIFSFSGFSGSAWNDVLAISNWDGIAGQTGGADQFLVHSDPTAYLPYIYFTEYGQNVAATAISVGTNLWEIVPNFSTSFTWDGTPTVTGNTANNWLRLTSSTYQNWVGNPTNAPTGDAVPIYMRNVNGTVDNWNVDANGTVRVGYWYFSQDDNYTILQNTDDGGGAENVIELNVASGGYDQAGTAFISMQGSGNYTIGAKLYLIDNLVWSNSGSGTVIKNGADLELRYYDLTMRGSNTTTISSNITSFTESGVGELYKEGTGTLILSGNNTYNGITVVRDGVLEARSNTALGNTANGTTVNSGGTLALSNNITVTGETLSIVGTGYNNLGALRNISGTNQWNQNITLAGNTTIVSDSGILNLGSTSTTRTLALGTNTLTIDGSGDTNINSNTSGAGSLIKNGTGTLTLNDAPGNASSDTVYTGSTTINAGTMILSLNNGSADDLTGTITIGDGIGTDTLRTVERRQIDDGASVIMRSSGVLDFATVGSSSEAETIGSLSMEGGALVTGSARSLTLNGTLTRVATGDTSATIASNLILGSTTRTIQVADNANAAIDLDITGNITSGGIVKTGDGTLRLAGTNTFTSAVAVNAGTVIANNAQSFGTTAGGTTVASGATLRLDSNGGSNLAIGAEALTLNGSGTDGNGALYNQAGNNSWAGVVTFATDATVGVNAGTTLTFSGTRAGSGDLTKAGAGELNLTGAAGTWTGDVNVNGGTLRISNANSIHNDANLNLANTAGVNVVLNGVNETIGGLNGGGSNGGNVQIGANTLTVAGNNNSAYFGTISGTGDLVKSGDGRLTLSGQNTLTGDVYVNDGTLRLASGITNAINGADQIIVNGGTLELYDQNQISDSTDLVLTGGGKIDTDGHDDVVGTLTLSGSGFLDLGEGTSILRFDDSSALAWTSGDILVIENWNGNLTGGGTDQIYFGSDAGGLTNSQIRRVFFLNPNGWNTPNGGYWAATILEDGELVPVPEPGTIIGAGAVLALIGGHAYRRRRKIEVEEASEELSA